MPLPSDPRQVMRERLGLFYPHRRPRGTKVDVGWDRTTKEQPMVKVPASGEALLLTYWHLGSLWPPTWLGQ